MTKKLRTGIYPRVSSDRQVKEGYSLEAQRNYLNNFAISQGWEVVGDYGDEGISAKNVIDRPGVMKLIADIEANKIDAVVLYKFDRLTRGMRDTEEFIDLIQTYGILVYTLSGGAIDVSTPSGRFNTRIQGAVAQLERETIIERVVDGFIQKTKNGYSLCSGTPSYGYDRPKGQEIQTINLEEAEVVKRIFKMYDNGKTFTEIADTLNSEGIKTKKAGKVVKKRGLEETYIINSVWQAKTIRLILSNVNYIGKVRYGVNREQVSIEEADDYKNKGKGFITDGLHEPIIDMEMWNRVQKKLGKIKKVFKTNYPKEEVYYCGTLACGVCGHKLTTQRTIKTLKDGTKHIHHGYRCINREKGLCTARGMSHLKIEKAFLKYLENIDDFEELSEIEIQEENDAQEEIKSIKKRLNQKQLKIKEIMRYFMNSQIQYEDYQMMKTTLEKECDKLEKELKAILPQCTKKEKLDKTKIAKDISSHWQELTKRERLQFLTEFVKKIVVVNRDENKLNGVPEILELEFYDDTDN